MLSLLHDGYLLHQPSRLLAVCGIGRLASCPVRHPASKYWDNWLDGGQWPVHGYTVQLVIGMKLSGIHLH